MPKIRHLKTIFEDMHAKIHVILAFRVYWQFFKTWNVFGNKILYTYNIMIIQYSHHL